MIKCKINSLVIALVLLVPCLAFALPGAHDPASGNSYSCNSCHINPATYGNTDANYASNVCLRCHSGTGDGGRTAKTFAAEDFANPFNTVNKSILPTGGTLQTSHKWFGSDTVPAAGAVAPVDNALSNGLNKNSSFVGTLSCARCHNVHGTSGLSSNKSPFLRYPNDSDQLCVNCHRPRDTKNHALGTHPVNVSYTSASVKAKIAAGKFLASPISNPSNPTGQVKLVNSKVLCSTCHRVHNTDSRTSTFDPYSAGQTFGQLSSSKGYLLRVDARGKAANDVNICTNCHAGKFAHNGNNQNIQCNDCHGGHVEYDATAPAELKNVYLVRRFNTYSAPLGGFSKKRVLFRYTSASNREYYNYPAKTGVCQGCHNPTNTHFTLDNEANGLIAERIVCVDCHKHNDPAGSFKASGCDVCHGYPPVANTVGGPNGKASAYTTFDESLTPHASHAAGGGTNYKFSCTQCHNGYSHNTGTFTDVFISPAGTLAGSSAAYSSPNCSSVYCHSDGNGVFKPIAWNSPKFIGQAGECTACHNNTAITTGSHSKHVTAKGYGCETCHNATVSNSTTLKAAAKLSGGTHVNGTKDVQFSGDAPATGTSCATVACHSNGRGAAPLITPDWTNVASGACGACHATATSTPVLSSNAHFKHFSSTSLTYGPRLAGNNSCITCHNAFSEFGVTHVNGTVDVNTSGTCTIQCHRNAAPTWTSSTRLACETCHDGNVSYDTRPGFNNISAPRKVMTTFTTNGHGKYNSYYCTNCHDNTSKHITGKRGDSNRLGAYENAPNNLCVLCHNNTSTVTNPARNNMLTHVSDHSKVYPPTGLCSTCHDVHGTANYASVMSTITFSTLSSAVTISYASSGLNLVSATTGTQRGLCQVCHTKTNHFRRDKPESGAASGWNTTGTSHIGFDSAINCLLCHKHNVGSFAFSPSGGACDSCHGYPPTPKSFVKSMGNYSSSKFENISGAGGSHIVAGHIPKSANPAQGFALCNSCHNQNDHNMGGDLTKAAQIKVSISSRLRFNPAIQPKYSSNKMNDTSHLVGNCSNVSCHFQSSPKWGNKP